jgi:hypothetical protein
MVNNVIWVVDYVIAARPSLLNFVIARQTGSHGDGNPYSGLARHYDCHEQYQRMAG